MQQNATLKLDGADAGTMNVGSNGARRSALTPDEWVEARPDGAAADAAESSSTRRARATDGNGEDGLEAALARLTQASRGAPSGRGARDLEALLSFALEGERRARDNALKTATALDSVARWIERTEDRMAEAARTASEGWQRAAAALQAVETFEGRLSKAEQTSLRQEPIASVLRDLQDRIVKLDERLSAMPARPIGRRGLDARDEVKNAIAEIKARQSELEAVMDGASQAARSAPIGSDEDALRALNDDIARLTGQLETVQSDAFDFDASAIEAVRDEVGRLQASLAGVATRDDVTALERSVLHFAERVAQARSQGDMTGVKAPLEDLQNEVRRLSEAVASGLPRRLTGEIEQLAGKIDAIAQAGVDPAVVGTLSRDIGEMRRVLSGLAEPRRIQDLSRVMTELSAQVAEIAARQVDAVEFSSLKASVEDIRAALKGARPEVRGADYTKQFDRLSQDIERLSRRVHELAPGGSGPVESGALLQRLDRLDESLRRPVRGDDLKPIEDLLRSLVGKIEQTERDGPESEALDALERQVATLADRIERAPPSNDPTLAALERAMGDLMAQVESMRDDTFQAVEQAARTAVAGTLTHAAPASSVEPGSDAVERSLAAFKAHQDESDRRTQDALVAVQVTLEQIVTRLTSLEAGGLSAKAAPAQPSQPRVNGRASAAPAAAISEAGPAAALSVDEVLLEPGAGRPRAGAPGERGGSPDATAKPAVDLEAPTGDVKAAFIAAARRAAQAAAAEAAAGQKSASRLPKFESLSRGGAGGAGLVARAKTLLDTRRRPILLGLAAVVLAIGALQVTADFVRGGAKPIPAAQPTDVLAQNALKPADRASAAPAQASADPQTTQSLAEAAPAASKGVGPAASQAQPPSVARERDAGPTMAAKRDATADAQAANPTGKPDAAKPGEPAQAAPALASLPPSPANAPTPAAGATPGGVERIKDMASVGDIPANVGPAGLRAAALAGEPGAVYELAARAAEGRGLPRDLKLAAKLFEKAAAHGLVPAQYRIGNFYEKGLGVTRDLALARQWYERAAQKGNAKAMHNLAVLLAEGAGSKPDYAAAVEWFRRGAEHGVRDSQFNLAVLLARGLGAGQDLAGAYMWFAIAAKQGDEDAAKKRDEVGARMAPTDLGAAKAAAERWRATPTDAAVNEVALPAQGWSEAPAKKAAGAGSV